MNSLRHNRPGAAAVLLVVSPFVAEFVPGNQYLTGAVDGGLQVGMFVVFVLFYGCATVLIREVTRRTGRGWPTIFALGLALALIEEGILAQSLFNPKWAGLDLLSYGHIPGLGTGGPWALYVLAIHVVWSVAVPIAVVEAMFPSDSSTPWLSAKWLTLPAVGLVVGSALIFATSTTDFMASAVQVGTCLLVAAVATWVAFRSRRPRDVGATRGSGSVAAFIAALLFTSAFQWAMKLPPWSATLTCVMLAASLGGWALFLRRRAWPPLWSALGALGTYVWFGLSQVNVLAGLVTDGPVSDGRDRFLAQAFAEQASVALLAIGLAAWAAARLRAHPRGALNTEPYNQEGT